MAKLTQIEQANILEKVLAAHNSKERMETWVLQLLESLKEIADLCENKDVTLRDIRATALEIRYNLQKGPVQPEEYQDVELPKDS